jgi:plasmid stabilization system protein ParE
MTRPVILTPLAEADLAEGKVWYDDQRDGLGTEFVLAVEKVLHQIGATPEMHQVVRDDVRKSVVRRFPYVVFYRAEPDRVVVLAVHDARRDPAR